MAIYDLACEQGHRFEVIQSFTNGDRDYVTHLRRTAEERTRLEERHPELAGDRRPIVAHEGRFEHAPLRAGDPLPRPD